MGVLQTLDLTVSWLRRFAGIFHRIHFLLETSLQKTQVGLELGLSRRGCLDT